MNSENEKLERERIERERIDRNRIEMLLSNDARRIENEANIVRERAEIERRLSENAAKQNIQPPPQGLHQRYLENVARGEREQRAAQENQQSQNQTQNQSLSYGVKGAGAIIAVGAEASIGIIRNVGETTKIAFDALKNVIAERRELQERQKYADKAMSEQLRREERYSRPNPVSTPEKAPQNASKSDTVQRLEKKMDNVKMQNKGAGQKQTKSQARTRAHG